MIVGFTGTQGGMTDAQLKQLRHNLEALMEEHGGHVELHHGDCVGADMEAASLAKQIGVRVIGHPPVNPAKRAFFPSDEDRPVKKYLNRNKNIVIVSEKLFAAPSSLKEGVRSGTWATVRYARQKGIDIVVLAP